MPARPEIAAARLYQTERLFGFHQQRQLARLQIDPRRAAQRRHHARRRPLCGVIGGRSPIVVQGQITHLHAAAVDRHTRHQFGKGRVPPHTPAGVGADHALPVPHELGEQTRCAPVDIGEMGIAGLVDLHGERVGAGVQIGRHVDAVHDLAPGIAAPRSAPDKLAVDPEPVAAVRRDAQFRVGRQARQRPACRRAKVQVDLVQVEGMGRADPDGLGWKEIVGSHQGVWYCCARRFTTV